MEELTQKNTNLEQLNKQVNESHNTGTLRTVRVPAAPRTTELQARDEQIAALEEQIQQLQAGGASRTSLRDGTDPGQRKTCDGDPSHSQHRRVADVGSGGVPRAAEKRGLENGVSMYQAWCSATDGSDRSRNDSTADEHRNTTHRSGACCSVNGRPGCQQYTYTGPGNTVPTAPIMRGVAE